MSYPDPRLIVINLRQIFSADKLYIGNNKNLSEIVTYIDQGQAISHAYNKSTISDTPLTNSPKNKIKY